MQFNLLDILLLAIVIFVGFHFWRVRAISEQAQVYLQQYCEKQGLQFISCARRKTRLTTVRGKLDWYSEFNFEFSGNGEDSYTGAIAMRGLKVVQTDLPAYRI